MYEYTAIFTKRNKFWVYLSARLDPKWGLLFKEKFCSWRTNSSLQELTPIEKVGKSKTDSVSSPENIPVHLTMVKMVLTSVALKPIFPLQ